MNLNNFKKISLTLIFLFIVNHVSYSQIIFEKGYVITINNEKINCLIEYKEWDNNPSEFEYKFSESGDSKVGNVTNIKEFGIKDNLIFVNKTIDLDIGDDRIEKLDNSREPNYSKKTVFLKTLVKGENNVLYSYQNEINKKYFYSINNSETIPLVHRKYKQNYNIRENNGYKQDLKNNFNCNKFNEKTFTSLNYKENDLVKFFVNYNKCNNYIFNDYSSSKKISAVNLSLRPRINSNSFKTLNNSDQSNNITSFGSDINYGLGLELELLMSFQRNKWAVFFEPTFNLIDYSYRGKYRGFPINSIEIIVEESTLETPIGLRHYIYVNENSKFYLNGSINPEIVISSSSKIKRRIDGVTLVNFDTGFDLNYAVGIGYKYDQKYGIEFRYIKNPSDKATKLPWEIEYDTFSFIFGYSFL